MDTNPNTIIDSFGGTSAVAELCDITTGAVSQWRTNGIPKSWLRLFRELRPDLFGGASPATVRANPAAPEKAA